jgi:uncharacterized protein YidB (DUF937 family)
MGLLDGLLGQVLGGALNPDDGALRGRGLPGGMGGLEGMLGGARGGAGSGMQGGLIALLPIVLGLLRSHGGLGGLLSQFQQAGYGRQADSWVAPGENMPIDGDALSRVLGAGELDSIAAQLGLPRREAADRIASALPDVVNDLTPQGAVRPDSDDLVDRALAILERGAR